MKNSIILMFAILFSIAHSQSNSKNLIIDTDMSLDDIRAVTYFSKLYDFNVTGYIATEGIQSSGTGSSNLKKLLKAFEDNAPVYNGAIYKVPESKSLKNEREFVYNLNWKELPESDTKNQSLNELAEKIKNSKDRYTYVAMGPLTNLKYLIDRIPDLKDRLDAIYFFGGIPEYTHKENHNYLMDTTAANYVLNHDVPFYSFTVKRLDLPIFDHRAWNGITSANNNHIEKLNLLFQKKKVLNKMFIDEEIYKYYSDIIPLYMDNPSVGKFGEEAENFFQITKWDKTISSSRYYLRMKEKFAKNLKPKGNISFREFPVDVETYDFDIARHIDFLIQTYGTEEFKSIVIANEFHSSINSYVIIGAKMGIRARELLSGEFDNIEAKVSVPDNIPESLVIDGIQIATGASPGNGKLIVDGSRSIKAEFVYGTKKVELELKDEVYDKIKEQYEEAISIDGEYSDSYFEFLRRVAINNWIDFNRSEIFDEEIDEAKPRRN